jgi:hypothetical protein
MYQDYFNCPWPLSVRLQGRLLSSFNIYNNCNGFLYANKLNDVLLN